MQQCNKNVENGVKNIVSQLITSSFDAQAFSAFSALIQIKFCLILASFAFIAVWWYFLNIDILGRIWQV